MNIKERNDMLLLKMDALRFGHVDHSNDVEGTGEIFNPFKFEWDQLVKPPIIEYLHPKTIEDLTTLVSDVKLMNHPEKKYKFMNEILQYMKFKPLASGTNRRAFYCEYDPTIILKIGSDRVGKTDNISEYYTQSILKPFCSKIYDVLPSGIAALCERAEPMKEKDFKEVWSKEIFDLIMNLLYRGYALEDIGGNYFKNWAVRIGFGPILIDFPYVYEIDWGKLKCIYVDPKTKKRCTGELDYDYSKGMSEIVCDTCGSRYSASYLQKGQTGSYIAKLRKGKMKMEDKFGVVVMRGNRKLNSSNTSNRVIVDEDLVNRIIREAENEANKKFVNRSDYSTPIQNSNTDTYQRDNNNDGNRRTSKTVHVSFDNAPKKKPNPYAPNPNNNNNGFRNRTPIRDEIMPNVTEFLDEIFYTFGRGAAIDLSRRLGVFWIDPNRRDNDFTVLPQRVYNYNQEGDNNNGRQQNREYRKNTTRDSSTQQERKPNESYRQNEEVNRKNERNTKTTESKEEVVYRAQTDGLFPVKPMTQEEIEKLDSANREEENAIMGFPGEPLVTSMAMAQYLPMLKKRIEDNLNGFVKADTEEKTIQYLYEQISLLSFDEIARICKTDKSGIDVLINSTLDQLNHPCYAVSIQNRKSPMFDLTIYPAKDNTDSTISNTESRKIAEGINPLDQSNTVVVEDNKDTNKELDDAKEAGVGSSDFNNFLKEKTIEFLPEMKSQKLIDQKPFMIQSLVSELRNAGLQFAISNNIAREYVETNYPFEKKKEEVSVVDNL